MKNSFFLFLFLIIAISIGYGIEASDEEWELYTEGLEHLIDGDTQKAIETFEEFIETYPESDLRHRVELYLEELETSLDHSGIVTFYLGNLGTAAHTITTTFVILEVTDGLAYGAAGIAGIAGGIGSAYLMTQNNDMSFARDLWIEGMQAIAITSYEFAYLAFIDQLITDPDVSFKVNLAGSLAAGLSARAVSYLATQDRNLNAGRPALVLTAYSWTQAYLWLTLTGIMQSDFWELNHTLALTLPVGAAAGSYFLWDNLNWSASRTGFMTVGGLAGMLTGVFSNLIIGTFTGSTSSQLSTGVILGGGLIGQGLTYYLTQGMEPAVERDDPQDLSFSVYPAVTPDSFGFQASLSM
ncbi:MAG: hypothetical protein ACLFR1_15540 [Spirochaetia bacterium]